ncbi:hypothetical protein FHW23_001087 [Curtobacterium pusillum]|uniref:Uncharacterized protein n=1 Tax=Curtobacterium pusillum TaxID=69373 RepID=A0AAW3T4K2_9MICO|nr:hypothetical protein [Curtobacterium pusillum]MBA8989855.1 hypothetical protein [Curtobacterium pusillum]
MSSTPLFDSIARRTDPSVPAQTASAPSIARATFTPAPAPAPTSPMSPPVDTADAVQVPAALVAAIEDVPARVAAAMQNEHVVSAEQLVLVEAVADAITRAVVDAVATELERIARDGIVRA